MTQDIEALVEQARRIYRALEMSAGIMRDRRRTGGWEGSERTADAFERQAKAAKGLHDTLTALAAEQSRAPTDAVGREALSADDEEELYHGIQMEELALGGRIGAIRVRVAKRFAQALALTPPASDDAIAAKDAPPDEDWLTDIIDDSLDMDWTGRVGARAIIAAWDQRHGS